MRDPLLRQLQDPLWKRVDRRLAAVLAVSIGGHLAVAVAAWLGDPPVERGWLVTEEMAAYLPEQEMAPLVLPAPDEVTDTTAPGIAAPAPRDVIPARRPGRVDHGKLAPKQVAPINASALISDLVDDSSELRAATKRASSEDLNEQLTAAKDREGKAQVGKDGAPERLHIGDGGELALGDPAAPTRTEKRDEAPPPRLIPGDPPPDIRFDPTDEINQRMRALQRCYRTALDGDPTLAGSVDLEFTIDEGGRVTSAKASGLDGVDGCVSRLARAWSFPVKLPHAATFEVTLVFSPR
jgi:hypothetical protein